MPFILVPLAFVLRAVLPEAGRGLFKAAFEVLVREDPQRCQAQKLSAKTRKIAVALLPNATTATSMSCFLVACKSSSPANHPPVRQVKRPSAMTLVLAEVAFFQVIGLGFCVWHSDMPFLGGMFLQGS